MGLWTKSYILYLNMQNVSSIKYTIYILAGDLSDYLQKHPELTEL